MGVMTNSLQGYGDISWMGMDRYPDSYKQMYFMIFRKYGEVN
jgi:hypothetical protein